MKAKSLKTQQTLVLIATFFFYSGTYGVLNNSIGVLFAGILQDMPFRAGDLSIYYTIRAMVSALTLTFTAKLALSRHGNRYVALFGLLAGLSLASMALYQSLWQWYVSAVVAGFAIGCVLTVAPVVISNWFRKNTGLLTGVTLSGAGIFGMFFNPLFSYLVGSFGWRRAALIVGLIQAAIVSIPAYFLYSASPEESDASPEESKEAAPLETIDAASEAGKKEPAWVFFVCFFSVLFFLIQVNFGLQLGTYAISIGYSLAVGGSIASLSMIGNISGKFLLGYLSDRFGIFNAMRTMICGSLISMVCFFFAESYVLLIYLGGITFGLVYSLTSISLPLLLKDIYGKDRYVQKLKIIQSVNIFISAFSSSVVAYIYDFTGSFRGVFAGFIVMSLVSFGLVTLLKVKGKQEMAC